MVMVSWPFSGPEASDVTVDIRDLDSLLVGIPRLWPVVELPAGAANGYWCREAPRWSVVDGHLILVRVVVPFHTMFTSRAVIRAQQIHGRTGEPGSD